MLGFGTQGESTASSIAWYLDGTFLDSASAIPVLDIGQYSVEIQGPILRLRCRLGGDG